MTFAGLVTLALLGFVGILFLRRFGYSTVGLFSSEAMLSGERGSRMKLWIDRE